MLEFEQDPKNERYWTVKTDRGLVIADIRFVGKGVVLINPVETNFLLSTWKLVQEGAQKIADEGPYDYKDLDEINTTNKGLIRFFCLGKPRPEHPLPPEVAQHIFGLIKEGMKARGLIDEVST